MEDTEEEEEEEEKTRGVQEGERGVSTRHNCATEEIRDLQSARHGLSLRRWHAHRRESAVHAKRPIVVALGVAVLAVVRIVHACALRLTPAPPTCSASGRVPGGGPLTATVAVAWGIMLRCQGISMSMPIVGATHRRGRDRGRERGEFRRRRVRRRRRVLFWLVADKVVRGVYMRLWLWLLLLGGSWDLGVVVLRSGGLLEAKRRLLMGRGLL